ncbi:hypothetical protein KBY82_07365 [Cyanobium sp. AMD-g]|uniref:hypothetical protein n=1 Tax=Cyanobium sp. AMD-g TaxID=2823699 RepID=UPI0020CD2426|nr:hypothetical protein [Cyanobium sp. AMD-g]MCP9930597.1 hypothetical protein [Cyanobium sp. AMD-g]
MPEPDPRRTRLVELQGQLNELARLVLETPVDSPDRPALDQHLLQRLEQVLALRGDLES